VRKKFLKANGKAISNFRIELGLKQKSIILEAKKINLIISLRNYQRAEAGEKISNAELNSIALFFDQSFKRMGIFKRVSLLDIVIFDKNRVNNNFSISKIKNLNDFEKQSAFLYNVNSYNQLLEVVKKSNFRKIFYQFNPITEAALLIKELLEMVNDIEENLNSTNNDSHSSRYGQEDLEKELKILAKMRETAAITTKLRDEGILLYASNFDHFCISKKLLVNELNRKDLHDRGDWEPDIQNNNYAIFFFTKINRNVSEKISNYISFDYRNRWYEDKLRALISKPYTILIKNELDIDAETIIFDHYKDFFLYYWDLDIKRADFSKVDINSTI
jgi:hypothetical protein